MIAEYEGKIAFRLPIEEKRQIEQLTREGKYKNVSQVIRAALKEFLKTA